MFNIGETISHKKIGLCTIIDKKEIEDIEYYVLNKKEDNIKVMVPVNNSNNLIRNTVTKQEIQNLKDKYKEYKGEIILDYKSRIKKYDELLKTGDVNNIMIVLKTIYAHKKERNNLTQADKDILKQAEKQLFTEFAFVLNINVDDVKKILF